MGQNNRNALKRNDRKRSGVNNAETFVDDLGGETNGLDSLFVDDAPKPQKRRSKKRATRASDRRRKVSEAQAPSTAVEASALQSETARTGMNLAIGVLTCVQGPEEGLALSLIEGSYTIGRARENNFIIKDLAASRRHLQIDVDGHGVYLKDMGSGNGSRHNGKPLKGRVLLSDGDRVGLGDSELVFTLMSADKSIHGGAIKTENSDHIRDAANALALELAQKHSNDFAYAAETSLSANKRQQEASLNRLLVEPAPARELDPAEMWKETGTGFGLSQAVHKAGGLATPDEITGSLGAVQRPPPMRSELESMPRPQSVQPRQERNRSAIVPIVLAALLGLAVLGAALWFFVLREPQTQAVEVVEVLPETNNAPVKAVDADLKVAAEVPEVKAVDKATATALSADKELEFTALLKGAIDDQNAGRHQLARRGFEKALEIKPTDAATKTLLEVSNGVLLKESITRELKEKAAADKALADKAAEEKALAAAAAQRAANRVKKAPVKKAPVKKRVVKKRPPKKTTPTRSSSMSDTKAKGFYARAMKLVRSKDGGEKNRGCKIIKRIARDTSSSSPWGFKARNILGSNSYDCR